MLVCQIILDTRAAIEACTNASKPYQPIVEQSSHFPEGLCIIVLLLKLGEYVNSDTISRISRKEFQTPHWHSVVGGPLERCGVETRPQSVKGVHVGKCT
jgi:hypothetical protein